MKEENPDLTKPQLFNMIGISDSSLKRIMKDLNMKSFYRHEAPVNRKKADLTVNKKINLVSTKGFGIKELDSLTLNKGTKKLSSKSGFVWYPDIRSNHLDRKKIDRIK